MEELNTRIKNLLLKLNVDEKKRQIKEIEAESTATDFWQDHKKASSKMKDLSILQEEVEKAKKLEELAQNNNQKEAEKLLNELEALAYFSASYDSGSAIVSLHSGQGGVEAMDWVQMLFRMYSRYFEKKEWDFEILEETPGEEAGLKSITISVNGKYAYGLLKEKQEFIG